MSKWQARQISGELLSRRPNFLSPPHLSLCQSSAHTLAKPLLHTGLLLYAHFFSRNTTVLTLQTLPVLLFTAYTCVLSPLTKCAQTLTCSFASVTSPSLLPLQVKCDQYWPTRGTETYGLIQVTLLDTVELATYSVRTFALYKVTRRVQRTVMGSAVYWFVEIFMGAGGYVCLRFSLRRCHGCILDTTWHLHGFLGVFAFFKNHPSFNLGD